MYDTITIPLGRAACYGTLEVNTDAFAPHVQRHIYEYGLRQILNDAIAEKKDEDGTALPHDQLRAKAQKRLDTLLSGELRTRSASEPGDPLQRIVHALCRDALLARWRRDGAWGGWPKGTKDRFLFVANARRKAAGQPPAESEKQVIEELLAAAPKQAVKWRKQAEEQLASLEDDLGIAI